MGFQYTNKTNYKSNPRYAQISIYTNRSYINPIAQNYFNRIQAAGGNVEDKVSVNEFCNQLSAVIPPQLWVCWPLRSTQNIGAGTSAFPLGGIAMPSSTLINGPTWQTDGINFSSQTQYISTALTSNQPFTLISMHRIDSNSSPSVLWDGPLNQLLFLGPSSTNLQAGSPTLQTVGAITVGQTFLSQVEFNGASGSVSLNGAGKTTRNMGTDNMSGPLRIGSLSAISFGRVCSMVLFVKSSNVPLLYNLVKQTLGTGLSLP